MIDWPLRMSKGPTPSYSGVLALGACMASQWFSLPLALWSLACPVFGDGGRRAPSHACGRDGAILLRLRTLRSLPPGFGHLFPSAGCGFQCPAEASIPSMVCLTTAFDRRSDAKDSLENFSTVSGAGVISRWLSRAFGSWCVSLSGGAGRRGPSHACGRDGHYSLMSSVLISAAAGFFVATCLGEFRAVHFICTLEPACWLAYTPSGSSPVPGDVYKCSGGFQITVSFGSM